MKRLMVIAALVLTLGLPAASPAGAASPRGCSVTWGSLAKSAGPATSPGSPITDVRTGEHACYDRFVVDMDGPASGYAVRYVRRYRAEGSGNVIRLPGGARLEIIAKAPANGTYPGVVGQRLPGVSVAGYQTFRSTRYGGSFEGVTSFGLGVRARLPFRVLRFDNHLIVDVAHNW